jgi:hypothetical protein
MSALDDAIASQLAHGAGACADPLTDSLFEQCTQPVPLRPGWEHEPAEPPVPWFWMALVVVLTLAASAALAGCGGGDLLPDDDDAQRIDPPACTTHPERCR